MRNTRQKELILSIINNSHDHLRADNIYKKAKKTIPNISLGTVYRILNSLVESKKIKKIKLNDGDHYDNINEKHNHFICDKCHKIIDVKNNINLICKIGKNKVTDYEINFIGICEDCLKKQK